MIGRMFVNELSPNATAIDFSIWPGQILDKEKTPEGFAYHKVLDLLGIRMEVVDASRTALLSGETDAIQQRLPHLQRSIGLVARYGAELDSPFAQDAARAQLGWRLGLLTAQLRAMPADTPFVDVATAITRPFAEDANDPKELFSVIPGGTPWWFSPANAQARADAIASFTANTANTQEQR